MLDIIVLEHLHPKDIAWVARSSLAQAPLFGYIFKLPNLILIDHKKRSSIKYLSQRAKEEHQNSRPIAIFPEGTRGKDNSIKKFQAGAKIVANNLELKVQPIVLTNTRDRLDTDNLRSSSGEVEIIYLDTIDTKDKEWYKKVEESINRTYNKYS
jgi:1-acyl-sn-glycerol-3-phosphate acyltransferase